MGDDYATRVPPLEWIAISPGKLGLTYLGELKLLQRQRPRLLLVSSLTCPLYINPLSHHMVTYNQGLTPAARTMLLELSKHQSRAPNKPLFLKHPASGIL